MVSEDLDVGAHVILKSASGQSVLEAGALITPANVKNFLPTKKTIKEATKRLMELGFRIDFAADTHISILGDRKLFEEVFQVKLIEKTAPLFEPAEKAPKQPYYVSTVPPKIPKSLSRFIETVEFPAPPTYFSTRNPPALHYYHLRVPDDVARIMRVVEAHQFGITGQGVVLAMVDSGFVADHPYYVGRGYNIQRVIAGPNDPNPTSDDVGHGTGIAACALAVAPDVTFVPVKIIMGGPKYRFPNHTDSFTMAAQQSPHIITCSWGTEFRSALQLAVNDAIANGIVVVFACGNGTTVAWPGSEPAVISVGGAYVEDDGSIRAASYATSGTNPNNPGRQVPDLCGLCGMKPMGVYIAMPTQPNSREDRFFSGGVFPQGDETAPDDGWLAASGTSSAAPMVAGVAALLMQTRPSFVGNPAYVKSWLKNSCTDVITGSSGSDERAGIGPDLATGAGLVNALVAIKMGYPAIYPFPWPYLPIPYKIPFYPPF